MVCGGCLGGGISLAEHKSRTAGVDALRRSTPRELWLVVMGGIVDLESRTPLGTWVWSGIDGGNDYIH